MIIDQLENAERYFVLNERFARAFRFLREADLSGLGSDRVVLEGNELFAIPVRSEDSAHNAPRLEVHDRFIDIQYVVAGTENIGWKSRGACTELLSPFNPDRDVTLYADEPSTWISIVPGVFAILFPDDAHAPVSAAGGSYKILVKVSAG